MPLPQWIVGDPVLLPVFKLTCVTLCYAVSAFVVRRVAIKVGLAQHHETERIRRTLQTLRTLLRIIFAVVLLIVLGVQLETIPTFLGSFLAVVGVACFASWSILSNVTASLIIYAAKDLSIGDQVRIIDDKEPVEGVITDFRLWNVCLKRADGFLVYFPNSLILQRPIILLSRARTGLTTHMLGIPVKAADDHGQAT
jgi:small-conductance mechanosensitive channel